MCPAVMTHNRNKMLFFFALRYYEMLLQKLTLFFSREPIIQLRVRLPLVQSHSKFQQAARR